MNRTPVLVVLTDGEESLARSLDEARQDGWKVYASGRIHDVATFLKRHPDALFLVRGALLPKGREEQTLAACLSDGQRPYTLLARPATMAHALEGIDEELIEPFTSARLFQALEAAQGPAKDSPAPPTPSPVAPTAVAPVADPPKEAPPERGPRVLAADESLPIDPIGNDEVRLLKWIRRCTEDERHPAQLEETALRALADVTGSREGRLFTLGADASLKLACSIGVPPADADCPRLRGYAAEAAVDKTPRVIIGVPKSGASNVVTSHLVVPLVHPTAAKAVAVLSDRTGSSPYGIADIEVAVHLGRQLGENFTNAEQRADLEQKAIIDYATGLFTKRNFESQFDRAFANAQRQGVALSLMLIDVDNLKRWNDDVSYPAGDAVLRRVGEILSTSFRRTDAAFRYGGDEMAVILPKAARGDDGLSVVAEKTRAAVAAVRFDIEAKGTTFTVSPTVSIGFATYPRDASTAAQLFAAAETAVKRAKRVKNTICYADPLRG